MLTSCLALLSRRYHPVYLTVPVFLFYPRVKKKCTPKRDYVNRFGPLQKWGCRFYQGTPGLVKKKTVKLYKCLCRPCAIWQPFNG